MAKRWIVLFLAVALALAVAPLAAAGNEGGAGKGALRAQYGGRLYLSDVANHNGTLLAIVTPNAGTRTALGHVEWQVPGF